MSSDFTATRSSMNGHTKNTVRLVNKVFNRFNSTKVAHNGQFFITTPIFYVNSKPHLGHLYTLVVADAFFRFQKLLQNHKSYVFATGTDEHGLKIQEAAKNVSMDCKAFCDLNSSMFRELCDKFLISNTTFIRTSDGQHKQVVHKVWNELNKRGFIYKTNYNGWYSMNDETFVPNKQVKTIDEYRNELIQLISQQNDQLIQQKENRETFNENQQEISQDEAKHEDKIKNPKELLKFLDQQLSKYKTHDELRVDSQSGNLLEHSQESNYIFRLESVKDRLIDLIKNNEKFIQPDHFRNILINMIKSENLNDVSISRNKSRFSWGISVPNDDDQIIYVWFDALCNYLTVAGYNSTFQWPPFIQVLGKDIIKFHAIYWPAFLFALDLELPKRLHCHAHWTVDNLKMSKSKNNVIDPFDYLQSFRADGIRYFLLRTDVLYSDGNFSELKMRERVNNDLADILGNLLQRSTNLKLNIKQSIPSVDLYQTHASELANELIQQLNNLSDQVYANYEIGDFRAGIGDSFAALRKCNKLFFDEEPWNLVKMHTEESKQKLAFLLYLTYETLRITSILLSPIIPNCSDIVLNKLNVPINERYWDDCKLKVYQSDDRMLSNDKLIVYPKVY